MPLDVPAIQDALQREGVDGWLLYDFRGLNPIAAHLTGIDAARKMATRRWFYLVPARGEPRGLVHAIERHTLDQLPGAKRTYAGRAELERELQALLAPTRRVAMEYSPRCAIPYVSRVDAGTLELVRESGVEVVSSADLVQRFEAVWDAEALASHEAAAASLYRIKDRTLGEIARRRQAGPTTEYEIQQLMVRLFEEEGLVTDSAPVVACGASAANPHYSPSPGADRTLGDDQVVVLDLWGKHRGRGTVFADITWVAFTGSHVPERVATAFAVVRDARDAAVALVQSRVRTGQDVRGWEVDRAARAVVERAGFADYLLHRTGHSLGELVHGNGANMDDYETHDDRRLLPGTGFTIEPGLYFDDDFGVRTEINMYVGKGEARVTGPIQTEVVPLGRP